MRKFKVQFVKDKTGQSYYERSVPLESLELLLILCDIIEVNRNSRKTGEIIFIFSKPVLNTFCKATKLPLWILKKFAPETEWKDDYRGNKTVQRKNGRANGLRSDGRKSNKDRPASDPG